MARKPFVSLDRFWCAVAVIALVISAAYLTRGFVVYFRLPPCQSMPQPIDALRRWREMHYVMRGRNPYDVLFAHDPAFHGPPAGSRAAGRNSDVMEDLGIPNGVVYPPWAFPGEALFYWPGAAACFVYYGIWMFAGILATAAWGASEMRRSGGSAFAVGATGLSVLACAAWGGAVVVGNNPPIVVGLLVLCYVLLQGKRDLPAGLALGLAMLKPTVAGPFLLPLLINRRWTTIFAAAGLVGIECLLTWSLTHTSPLEMLQQMLTASRPFVTEGYGPAQYLMHAGISQGVANATAALLVLTLGGLGLYALRRQPMSGQFAIAALTARLWAYHLPYDDAILIFAVVFFACQLERVRSRSTLAIFLLLLVAMWLPGRLDEKSIIQGFDLLVWMLCGAAAVWFGIRNSLPRAAAT